MIRFIGNGYAGIINGRTENWDFLNEITNRVGGEDCLLWYDPCRSHSIRAEGLWI